MSKLLQAQGLGKRFGGLQALSDVSFDIEQGEICLIGPNRGQDHAVQRADRPVYPGGRLLHLQWSVHVGQKPHEVAYAGPHVPEHPPVRQPERDRERDDRPPHAYPRRRARRRAARGARAEEAAIEARARNCWNTSASATAPTTWRVRWRPAPPGDRARAGHRAEAAGAGRTRRRHERLGNGGAAQADREDPRRRHHRVADRARHEAGHGPVRPRAGAGIRQVLAMGKPARCSAIPRSSKRIWAGAGSADSSGAPGMHPRGARHRPAGRRRRAGLPDRRQRRRQTPRCAPSADWCRWPAAKSSMAASPSAARSRTSWCARDW